MVDRIAIDRELISTHAARVDQVASDISLAASAASSTAMGGGAFGVLCSFLVAPATAAATMAGTAITSAQGMVSRSGTEIRGVGSDMAAFESDVIAAISALMSEVS